MRRARRPGAERCTENARSISHVWNRQCGPTPRVCRTILGQSHRLRGKRLLLSNGREVIEPGGGSLWTFTVGFSSDVFGGIADSPPSPTGTWHP